MSKKFKLVTIFFYITVSSFIIIPTVTQASSSIKRASRPSNIIDDDGSLPMPIIGILSQPTGSSPGPVPAPLSYIAASYFKWIQAAGGRPIPLIYQWSWEFSSEVLENIDGILFPGGGAPINPDLDIEPDESEKKFPNFYGNMAYRIFQYGAARGIPIWGTCLGFEQVVTYSSLYLSGQKKQKFILGDVNSESQFLPLKILSSDKWASKFSLSSEAVEALTTRNITINMHHKAVLLKDYKENTYLQAAFGNPNPTASGVSFDGKEFVAAVVHDDSEIISDDKSSNNSSLKLSSLSFPGYIAATQFHPEKNAHEHDEPYDFPSNIKQDNFRLIGEIHSESAVKAMAEFSLGFVGRARRYSKKRTNGDNLGKFFNETLYQNHLAIENYGSLPGRKVKGMKMFTSVYLFGLGSKSDSTLTKSSQNENLVISESLTGPDSSKLESLISDDYSYNTIVV